ncbi:glycosyltransferase family 2 protein [Pseudoalteromonas sp. G4]|uniref:glycosyltransferase family 2 protein n=1 Tax=Pseudoalteromonas sp. G4 TaxID=2992761 RepID=UPI00237DBE36|nr:glycosyltransferase family 2 protein [Pseudoalteromonas sp. G4]MDE3273460.1 glycosyltransferase [Pseudoalteromonas sp. G4]
MCKEVSIIMPNYNCLAYLPKAIDSVLQQQDVRFELIVVDDGSTDGSLEWLLQAEKKYNQLRVITQPNLGVIAARNRAIKKANSQFIAFLDADDYWYPNKLRKQVDFMLANPNCGLTFTNYQHVDMQYRNIIDCFSYWPEFKKYRDANNTNYQLLANALNLLLIANVIGTSCVMVNKEIIERAGGFDPSLRSASDWDCWLRIALISEIGFCEDITMDYLMRPNSITANKQNRIDAMAEITERICTLGNVEPTTRRKANARLLESYGEMHREDGDLSTAISFSYKAFKEYPHKRHLKHLCSDLKRLAIMRVNALCQV